MVDDVVARLVALPLDRQYEILNRLKPTQRRALCLRFGWFGETVHTRGQIVTAMEATKSKVNRFLMSALARLREELPFQG